MIMYDNKIGMGLLYNKNAKNGKTVNLSTNDQRLQPF